MAFHRKYWPILLCLHFFGLMAGLISLTGMPLVLILFSFALAPACHIGLWRFHDSFNKED